MFLWFLCISCSIQSNPKLCLGSWQSFIMEVIWMVEDWLSAVQQRPLLVAGDITSNHFYCHITTAQVPWWVKFLWACSRQCRKTTTTIYIWTDSAKKLHWSIYSAPDSAKKIKKHIYRLYRRQCAKYTYIYSVHIVYYKDILNYQRHIIHCMGTSTLCTVSIHNVVYT